MISIILTYRNRDLQIVKNCLDSLKNQIEKDFKVILVDYGSLEPYQNKIKQLVKEYEFVTLKQCKTQYQLWNKSRAINIALKQCETPSVFVGDIDMLYHPDFVKTLMALQNEKTITYFQVGFLSEAESKTNKAFKDYKINFYSSEEATGMTLFSTEILKSINGYDEYYHGWGAEDTDVHLRLKNAGYKVDFYTDLVLMLHQWHPKNYRTVHDITPFHSILEQINHEYLKLQQKTKVVKANLKFAWGIYNDEDYNNFEEINVSYNLTNKESEIKAFIYNILLREANKTIQVNITQHQEYESIKQSVKSLIGKKTIDFLDMQLVNNLLLENIIIHLRDKPYQFQFNKKQKTINLIIKL